MPDGKPDTSNSASTTPFSETINEGGAQPHGLQGLSSGNAQARIVQDTQSELMQLHIRVIALENLVIALLAAASEAQLDRAREMATLISPRPDTTPHTLTIQAAAQMLHHIERAVHFRGMPSE